MPALVIHLVLGLENGKANGDVARTGIEVIQAALDHSIDRVGGDQDGDLLRSHADPMDARQFLPIGKIPVRSTQIFPLGKTYQLRFQVRVERIGKTVAEDFPAYSTFSPASEDSGNSEATTRGSSSRLPEL